MTIEELGATPEERKNIAILLDFVKELGWCEHLVVPRSDENAVQMRDWLYENIGEPIKNSDNIATAQWLAMTKADTTLEAVYGFRSLTQATFFKLKYG